MKAPVLLSVAGSITMLVASLFYRDLRGAIIGIAGFSSLLLSIRRSHGLASLTGLLGLAFAGILGGEGFEGLGFLFFLSSLLISWIPLDACDIAFRILGLALSIACYSFTIVILLSKYGATGRYLPAEALSGFSSHGGFVFLIVLFILYLSLIAYWIVSPVSVLPRVDELARKLYSDRLLPLEALVYSLVLVSMRSSPLVALIGIISFGLEIWFLNVFRRKEIALFLFISIYSISLYLTGNYYMVRDYLLSLFQ